MKNVAIIGAGVSGLVAAKSMLESGLKPVVFEQATMIGGIWRADGYIWDGMQTNLSKHTCVFSDFPWKKHNPMFPHKKEVYQYLCDYSKKHKLNEHINLQTKISKVSYSGGCWLVNWTQSGNDNQQLFDYVIVASGFFSRPHFPTFKEGYEIKNFSGRCFHSSEFDSAEQFANRKVVVVGGAFSGKEIASKIAMRGQKVIHIVNEAFWSIPRYIPQDLKNPQSLLPVDTVFYSRASESRQSSLTNEERNKNSNSYLSGVCSDQNSIDPNLFIDPSSTKPLKVAIADNYLGHVKKGQIITKKGMIVGFNADSIILQNDHQQEKEVGADIVILCTGYELNLDFLDKAILEKIEYRETDQLQPVLLHKCTFCPNLPNMAFVGIYRGPYFGVIELQARWAAKIFSEGGTQTLNQDELVKGLEKERRIRTTFPRPQFPHGNYVKLADSLAEEIKVLPDFGELHRKNPRLYNRLFNGPFIPAHYRLSGPHSDEKLALQAIDDIEGVKQHALEAGKGYFVMYQQILHPGKEVADQFKKAWKSCASYCVQHGAIDSRIHSSSNNENLWIIYSYWPDRETKFKVWDNPEQPFPDEIIAAKSMMSNCIKEGLEQIQLSLEDSICPLPKQKTTETEENRNQKSDQSTEHDKYHVQEELEAVKPTHAEPVPIQATATIHQMLFKRKKVQNQQENGQDRECSPNCVT